MVHFLVGASATQLQPPIWSLFGLWITWIFEMVMPLLSLIIANAITKGETIPPGYTSSIDPQAVHMIVDLVIYVYSLFIPVIWGVLVMISQGKVGGKALAWMIHHWSSNLTLLNLILAWVFFGLYSVGTKQEIWYISIFSIFAVAAWIVTMVLSIEAIQYGVITWLKVAPGWLWPSLFFIDNDLDGYLAEEQRKKKRMQKAKEADETENIDF